MIAAASNRESFAGSGLSGSIPVFAQPQQLEIVVEVGAQAPSFYYLGAEGLIQRRPEITRSTYAPNITRKVLTHLTTHPNAQNLFLLSVKYEDERGGDVQPGISESAHVRESHIGTALRGITEELHLRVARGFHLTEFHDDDCPRHHKHYFAQISSERDYSLVPIDRIRPDPSRDDRVKKRKASVYLFGTLEALVPIIRAYEPPGGRPDHDPIDKLCCIPFSELRRF